MIELNLKLLIFLILCIKTVLSFDCNSLSTLDSYLLNRGGSFNSAKCVAVVMQDAKSPEILKSPSCDALVIDSTDNGYSSVLQAANVQCPILYSSLPVVFNLKGYSSIGNLLGSIYCVDSSCEISKLYKQILDRASRSSLNNLLLPIIPSNTGNFSSRAKNAAFEIRTWLMREYGNNNMRCPFTLIIPTPDSISYNTVLDAFSLAFSKDQAAYNASLKYGPAVGTQTRVITPAPRKIPVPVPRPRIRPTPSKTPSLRDFNQYDGLACPTMKNFFDLLTEMGDPYINKYTSTTTQLSVTSSDFSFGIFSCDAIVMDSDSLKFLDLMGEMGLQYDPNKQEIGVTIRSPSFLQNSYEWFSSIQKVFYMSLRDAINEARSTNLLSMLIREAYTNIFDYANRNRLPELLILPFGLWSNGYSHSIEVTTACIEGLSEALRDFLLINHNTHITIVAESPDSLDVLIDQLKPYFMTVKASDELLGGDSDGNYRNPIPSIPVQPTRPLRPTRPPPPIPRPLPTTQWTPVSKPVLSLDSDGECLSGTPVSEFIQAIFNGRLPSTSSSNKVSLLNVDIPPGVVGCSCLVVDVSFRNQLDLLGHLGISESECTSVGSSEIKVLSVRSSNIYLFEPWKSSIKRVYCVNSARFIYNSRVKATGKLYRKILSSAKYRCNSILTPLLSVNLETSENRNKEYILEAAIATDDFFTHSPQRDSMHVTFYEPRTPLYFLALEVFSTYYLEYDSVGGTSATIRTINQNWISMGDDYSRISFNFKPSSGSKKKKCSGCSLKKIFTRRSNITSTTTTTTTTRRPGKVPPPRPPLPKFTGNKDATRPAPTNISQTFVPYISFSEFINKHSKSNCDHLYSMHYWITTLTSYTNSRYSDESKNIFLTNSGVYPGPENCSVVVVDAHRPNMDKILRAIGQHYPILSEPVTVIANNKYGDKSSQISKTLSRLFMVNVNLSSISHTYEKIISKAISNGERSLYLPIFTLNETYLVSRSRATALIKEVLKLILQKIQQHHLGIKFFFYEESSSAAYLLFEVLIKVLSGRESL